jgi:NADH:ubiquinone oxidoreductase subunit F (NADH-binding)
MNGGVRLAPGELAWPPRNGPDPGLPRLLPARPAAGAAASLADHLARHGPAARTDRRRHDLLDEVAAAGLTGRGGASFPTARKLAAVAAARGRPVVIANGTEGEPAGAKDKVLLGREPHLVLDGAALAASIIGASDAVIVTHRAVSATVAEAIEERRRARQDRVRLHVATAAGTFVGGEATAVANWLQHGIAKPTMTPPRLAERGVRGAPTLVQNVETLAHLALIGRHGASWFRALGTRAEPGSMLVTVIGAVARPGVYEIAIGTRCREILDLAGGRVQPLRALLLGGYFGSWVPTETAMAAPFSAAGLARFGAAPGAGLVAGLPAGVCGLAETARVARYLAAESAGQCGPCVFGLGSIAAEFAALATGRQADLRLLRRWLDQVDGRGGCSHPSGAVRLIRSALAVFSDEISRHADGWCCGTSGQTLLPVPSPAATPKAPLS